MPSFHTNPPKLGYLIQFLNLKYIVIRDFITEKVSYEILQQ